MESVIKPSFKMAYNNFLQGSEIDCVDKDGNTPLHVAARYGHELLINTLITSGAEMAQ